MDAETLAVQERYARFAREEVGERSPLYREWAEGLADDLATCGILARIPAQRRQPPLVFAVTRVLGAPEGNYQAWSNWVHRNIDDVAAQCAHRSLQTNEPLRCAALLPALSRIEGPIALLEVGASAGLCLYPDRYSYLYEGSQTSLRLDPALGPSSVELHCEVRGARLPSVLMPDVVWRAGIDLAPLDARDSKDRAWLAGLIWPGETGRVERIHAAVDVVAADPPLMIRGDALDVLADAAALAPHDATLVVSTPGVLAYLPFRKREALIDLSRELGRWITIDAPALHAGWNQAPQNWQEGFAVALDGEIVAATDPLGGWINVDV